MRQANPPSRSRRKRCVHCRELFDPDPRAKDRQRTCSKDECQMVRQRQNEKSWCERNPDCVADQKRKWQQKHPGYSRRRRAADPKLEQENRQETRLRMQKVRWQVLFDKSKLILTQLIGDNEDKSCLIRGQWLFLRLTRASRWTNATFVRHTGQRLKRVANRLPRGQLYDLSGLF
jgi:hypothetical protein